MARTILVGLDGSESSWKAFSEALAQAKSEGTTLHVITVQEDLPISPSAAEIISADQNATDETSKIQAKAEKERAALGVQVNYLTRHGDSAKALLDCAQELKADLSVIGKKGRSS